MTDNAALKHTVTLLTNLIEDKTPDDLLREASLVLHENLAEVDDYALLEIISRFNHPSVVNLEAPRFTVAKALIALEAGLRSSERGEWWG